MKRQTQMMMMMVMTYIVEPLQEEYQLKILLQTESCESILQIFQNAMATCVHVIILVTDNKNYSIMISPQRSPAT